MILFLKYESNESFHSTVFPQLFHLVPCYLSPVFPVSYVRCVKSFGAMCVSSLPCFPVIWFISFCVNSCISLLLTVAIVTVWNEPKIPSASRQRLSADICWLPAEAMAHGCTVGWTQAGYAVGDVFLGHFRPHYPNSTIPDSCQVTEHRCDVEMFSWGWPTE